MQCKITCWAFCRFISGICKSFCQAMHGIRLCWCACAWCHALVDRHDLHLPPINRQNVQRVILLNRCIGIQTTTFSLRSPLIWSPLAAPVWTSTLATSTSGASLPGAVASCGPAPEIWQPWDLWSPATCTTRRYRINSSCRYVIDTWLICSCSCCSCSLLLL